MHVGTNTRIKRVERHSVSTTKILGCCMDQVVQKNDEFATESLVRVPPLAWCVKATLLNITHSLTMVA